MSRLINPHTGTPMPSAETMNVYLFDPTPDIDALDLAYVLRGVMQNLGMAISESGYIDMPPNVQQHFTKVEVPKP